jgi:hypothetical protein
MILFNSSRRIKPNSRPLSYIKNLYLKPVFVIIILTIYVLIFLNRQKNYYKKEDAIFTPQIEKKSNVKLNRGNWETLPIAVHEKTKYLIEILEEKPNSELEEFVSIRKQLSDWYSLYFVHMQSEQLAPKIFNLIKEIDKTISELTNNKLLPEAKRKKIIQYGIQLYKIKLEVKEAEYKNISCFMYPSYRGKPTPEDRKKEEEKYTEHQEYLREKAKKEVEYQEFSMKILRVLKEFIKHNTEVVLFCVVYTVQKTKHLVQRTKHLVQRKDIDHSPDDFSF